MRHVLPACTGRSQPTLARGIDAVFLDPMLAARPRESSPANLTTAERRQFEYERAKNYCDAPPPPGSNECSTLSRQIDHAEETIKLYELWDANWNPSRHAQKIQNWKERLKSLKEEHSKKCNDQCKP
jgi:type VI secretion system secreted protein VgrG